MKRLDSYNAAWVDVQTNSIPKRVENNFIFSNGQRSYLDNFYPEMLDHNTRSKKLLNQKHDICRGAICLKAPLEKIVREITLTAQPETILDLENQQLHLKEEYEDLKNNLIFRDESQEVLDQFDLEPENMELNKQIKQNPSRKKKLLKHWGAFLIIWLIGEIFMTLVLWNILRDHKSVEDMIIRSMSLGLVLGFFHYFALLYKSEKRSIYAIFLSFNLLMIGITIFGPIFFYEYYPPIIEGSQTTIWSQTTDFPSIEYPVWVKLYQKYDAVLPAVMTFFAFLIMKVFIMSNTSTDQTPEQASGNYAVQTKNSPVLSRLMHLGKSLKALETQLDHLRNEEQTKSQTGRKQISQIHGKLLIQKSQIEDVDEKLDQIKQRMMIILQQVMNGLEQYESDYLEIIRNDIKAKFIHPSWPDKTDVCKYFNINEI